MARNPFEYVRPLEPADVRGRDDLVDRLVRVVRNRGIATLVGPRRFGKTSLLGHVVATAGQVDAIDAVVVDCYGVAGFSDFAVRLERAMGQLHGSARDAAKAILSNSELGLSLAPGIGFKAGSNKRNAPDSVAVVHELLDTLVAVSDRRDGLLVVLDEFQHVGGVENLDAVLRTHLQTARAVAALFAGSQPSMLRRLFTDKARPFYGQSELIEIGPLALSDAADIVEDGFRSSGRLPGDAPEHIAALTAGHPQRLMLVAHVLWEMTDDGDELDAELVSRAFDEVARRTEDEHRAMFDGLSRTHRDTLRAVAVWGSPMSRDAERALDLAQSSAQSAAKQLVADAVIDRGDDGWRVVDPMLQRWLQRLDAGI